MDKALIERLAHEAGSKGHTLEEAGDIEHCHGDVFFGEPEFAAFCARFASLVADECARLAEGPNDKRIGT